MHGFYSAQCQNTKRLRFMNQILQDNCVWHGGCKKAMLQLICVCVRVCVFGTICQNRFCEIVITLDWFICKFRQFPPKAVCFYTLLHFTRRIHQCLLRQKINDFVRASITLCCIAPVEQPQCSQCDSNITPILFEILTNVQRIQAKNALITPTDFTLSLAFPFLLHSTF